MPTPLKKANSITLDGLMAAAFDRPREPRSDAYKAGVRAKLSHAFDNVTIAMPYAPGTAEADAFFAGEDEGRAIFARTREGADLMNAEQWQQAIDVALDCVDELNHDQSEEMRARAFVAYLAGAVKIDDQKLSKRIFTVLRRTPNTGAQ